MNNAHTGGLQGHCPTTNAVAGSVIAVSTLGCACMILCSLLICFTEPNSFNPWESAIVLDAWRTAHGMNVYQSPSIAPATHMYGPLVTYLHAVVVLICGPSFKAARLISFFASAFTVALMMYVLCRGRRYGWLSIGFATTLLLAQFFRTRATYVDARPDALAALFSVIAVLLFAKARSSKRWAATILGTISLLIGFGFKQTAAPVALIPILVELTEYAPHRTADWIRAFVPAIAAGIATALIYLFWRPAYFYMFQVPREFPLQPSLWFTNLCQSLSSSVTFVVSAVLYAVSPKRHPIPVNWLRWIACSCFVTLVVSTLAVSKQGGAANSFLPAFLSMSAFVVVALPTTISVLSNHQSVLNRFVGGLFLALLLPIDMHSIPAATSIAFGSAKNGDRHFWMAVHAAKTLQGTVVSPDDPMIVFYANGFLGRNLKCELDTVGGKYVPPKMIDEIKQADWVISVKSAWPSESLLNLNSLGFVPLESPEFKDTAYALWKKADVASQQIDLSH